MNPYEVLEIPQGASADEIKAAYHRMAKQWHPDRFSGEAKVEAERRFRVLAEAFGMIKDTPRREDSAVPAAPAAPANPSATQPVAQIQLDAGAERTPQNKTVDEWFKDALATVENKTPERGLALIQYAIRLDGERAEFHALYGKLLDLTKGDKRLLVRTLETALRLNPRDLDSTILLAQTFQTLGMHARASRLWSVVRNQAPNHPLFAAPKTQGAKDGTGDKNPGLGEQLSSLVTEAKETINRIFKRG